MTSNVRRIRVVTAGSGLPEIKVWLQFDVKSHPTVADCKQAFAEQLGVDAELEISLDGFKLLGGISSETLDSAKDILELNLKSTRKAPQEQEEQRKAKRRKLSSQKNQGTSIELEQSARNQAAPKQIVQPLPKVPSEVSRVKQSTLLEVAALGESGSSATAQEKFTQVLAPKPSSSKSSSSSASFSSASSTSSSASSSSSSSASSSSSSSSDSDNSSSSSDSDESSAPSIYPILTKSQSQIPVVPPGAGKKETKNRNERKRKRAKKLKEAERDLAKATGASRPPASSKDVDLLEAARQSALAALASKPIVPEPKERKQTPVPVTSTPARPQSTVLPIQPDPLISTSISIADPTPLLAQDQLFSMLEAKTTGRNNLNNPVKLLSMLGNGTKARALRKEMAKSKKGALRSGPQKIVFGDVAETLANAPASSTGGAASAQSPSFDVPSTSSLPAPIPAEASQSNGIPSTPVPEEASMSIPLSTNTSTPRPSTSSILTRRPPPPPPSTRTDLPNNVIVTSVDVERDDFVPGEHTKNFEAPVQVPYHQPQGDMSSISDMSYLQSAKKGKNSLQHNGKKQKAKKKKAPGEDSHTIGNGLEEMDLGQINKLEKNGWKGWPASLEDLETSFAEWRKVTAPGDGEKIAVKILELSPESYMPSISAYYGIVMSLDSAPNAPSTIRLKLHPACRPVFPANDAGLEEVTEYNDEYENAWEAEQRPRRFGEDAFMQDSEGGEAQVADSNDEKVISLDDVVDCRRIEIA